MVLDDSCFEEIKYYTLKNTGVACRCELKVYTLQYSTQAIFFSFEKYISLGYAELIVSFLNIS